MAAPVSFDDIIKAGKLLRANRPRVLLTMHPTGREKKKNEALANEIFGRGRRKSAPGGALGNRKANSAASLASRVGVVKVCPYTSRDD